MNRQTLKILLALSMGTITALAQTEPRYLDDILKDQVLSPDVALYQLRHYISKRVAPPPHPSSASEWTAQSKEIREKILNDVVYHGWPKEWVHSPPKFEDLGVIPGDGYQMRKLRYEIIPGFQSTAILYEPLNMHGKVPAILNVNGHVGALGKSVEYKQKRCITFARNGIMALNLEWLAYGELSAKFNAHWYGAHLDLVGVNELGLFYLAMRRGLDYLYDHPNTDKARVGMTGLSGGGWQTIILSSLDERVKVAVPVAGFSSIAPRVEVKDYGDVGDVEQSASDLFDGRDYTWLAAMRAPRPTLLAYNAEDDCCFRAPIVKPAVYDAIRPFYELYDRRADFAWHENRDPGSHNYLLDNRTAAYEFFSREFHLPEIKEDAGIGAEIKSYDDLVVGLPESNQTILGLARQFATQIKRDPLPPVGQSREAWRTKLAETVKYQATALDHLWVIANTKHHGIETKSYLFMMKDELPTNAIWLKPIDGSDSLPATIVLDDKGKGAASEAVTDRVTRNEQVMAADLPFQGDAWMKDSSMLYGQMVTTTGARPLGIQVAHLIELATWLKSKGAPKVRIDSRGIRNQVVTLVAAALKPTLFSDVVIRDGMPSLGYLLEKPVQFQDAPDLFCLDLYKFADLDQLAEVSAPATVRKQGTH